MEAAVKVIPFIHPVATLHPLEDVAERREERKRGRKAKGWVVTPEKFLSDAEYERLLAHVRERRDAALQRGAIHAVRDAALVILLAKSGLRIGEAVALAWGDLQLRSAEGRPPAILVRHGKGGKTRLVAIGEELRRELKRWRQAAEARGQPTGEGDPVFPSQRGGPLSVSGAERIVSGAMARAAITGQRNPHRLRHTYASRLYRACRDLRLVQKLLGHSRVDTTAIYADLFAENVKAAVDKV
jgi:integrase